MNFADLGLSDNLLKAVTEAGYTVPTAIQAEAIPAVLMMKDIIGIAQTGTGKTASFVLPMIDILASGRRRALMPRSLILEPTRELAAQVAENFEKYGANNDLKMALLIGGVQMGDQLKALSDGVDVLIATPGRLMDLIERGKIMLNGCDMLVIDEADRMLDMGFIPDIEFICSKLPATRQTLLFSATMPPPIAKLAKTFLTNPKRIEVNRAASTNENITAFKIVLKSREKRETLRWLLRNDLVETAIIFANRKTTVRDINKTLQSAGFRSGEIHGDMDQSNRIAELNRFKAGEINILVASDVAARGLDIKGVSHVFNYDTPWHPDDYVHRVGRTGRAGAFGRAFTFVGEEDGEAIANVEKLTGTVINVFGKKDVRVALPEAPAAKPAEPKTDSAPAAREEREERPTREERPRRDRDERKPRREREARSEAPAKAARPPREEERKPRREEERRPAESRPAESRAEPRPQPQPRRDADEAPVPAGEWNGPMPGFLNVSAL